MGPIAIRRLLTRPRHRLAVALALLVVGATIGAHHAAPTTDMPGMDSAAVICLAVLGVGVGVGAAVGLGRRTLRLRRGGPRVIAARPPVSALPPRPAPARAGPLYLRLAVIRR